MFQIDGKPLPLDTPFEHGGISYPANWLRLSSQEDRAALGIVEVPEQPRADDRFYWNGDLSLPKDLDELKSQMVAQVKTVAGSLLAPTDWKVVRAAEGIKPVDTETLEKRAAIRKYSNENENAVMSCTTVEELAALQFHWPQEQAEQPAVTEEAP